MTHAWGPLEFTVTLHFLSSPHAPISGCPWVRPAHCSDLHVSCVVPAPLPLRASSGFRLRAPMCVPPSLCAPFGPLLPRLGLVEGHPWDMLHFLHPASSANRGINACPIRQEHATPHENGSIHYGFCVASPIHLSILEGNSSPNVCELNLSEHEHERDQCDVQRIYKKMHGQP